MIGLLAFSILALKPCNYTGTLASKHIYNGTQAQNILAHQPICTFTIGVRPRGIIFIFPNLCYFPSSSSSSSFFLNMFFSHLLYRLPFSNSPLYSLVFLLSTSLLKGNLPTLNLWEQCYLHELLPLLLFLFPFNFHGLHHHSLSLPSDPPFNFE
jgi:hypothetical protein